MSHCLILQQYNDFYIGADSAGSIKVGDSFYRTSNTMQKIYTLGTDIYFCSGVDRNVQLCNEWVENNNKSTIDVVGLSNFLKDTFSGQPHNSECFDIEILLCRLENGTSKVYNLAQYNEFDIVAYDGRQNQINIVCGGCNTAKGFAIAKEIMACGDVREIYRTVFQRLSDQRVGGCLSIYHQCNLIHSEKIDDYQISTHMVLADAVVAGYIESPTIKGGTIEIGEGDTKFVVNPNGSVEIRSGGTNYIDAMKVIDDAYRFQVMLDYTGLTVFSDTEKDFCQIVCKVYDHNKTTDKDITDQIITNGGTFTWKRALSGDNSTWSPNLVDGKPNIILIKHDDINRNAQISCVVDFDETKFNTEGGAS